MLLHKKSSQRSLKHKSGETAFATLISCPEDPTVEHHLNHDPFEEMMLVSLFISPNIASPLDPFNEELLKEDIREEWSNGIIDFLEVVWIDSPSITIPCSIRGITVEAQLIPTMEGNIMPWHWAHTLLSSVSLKPSGKLFESCPFGHILECRDRKCHASHNRQN